MVGQTAVLALGGPGGGVTLERVAPRQPSAPLTPAPPTTAVAPVRDLAAAPDGTLYLLAGNGLYSLAPAASGWKQIPEPVPPDRTWHLTVAGTDLYLTSGGNKGADALWRAPAGGGWSRLPVPPAYLGPLATVGDAVWLGTTTGPALVGASGAPTPRNGGLPAPISVVASAAWRPTDVAAGWSGAPFTSMDGGRHWRLATPPDAPAGDVTALTWSPDGTCLLIAFAGVQPPGTPVVYVSGDAGATWTRWPGLPRGLQTAPVESPVGSGVWWIVSQGQHPTLYRWGPGGVGWQAVAVPAAVGTARQVAPGPGGLWLADGRSHLWLLTFPRRTFWQRVRGKPAPPPRAARELGADGNATWVSSDPYDPSVVYAGTRRSTDGGRTWTSVPLPSDQILGSARLAFGPDIPGVAAPSGAGLARDAGQAWRTIWGVPSPVFGEAATAVAPAGPGRFYVAVQRLGLVVVPDASPTWRPPAVFSPGRWTVAPGATSGTSGTTGASGYNVVEAAAPSDPAVVYQVDLYGDVFRSSDGGRTFTRVGQAAVDGRGCCTPRAWGAGPHVAPSALAVSPTDPQVLYLGMALQGATSPPPAQGLWVSRDAGRTWHATGLPATATVFGAAAASGDTVYAVAAADYFENGGRLYRSTDGGATWTAMPAPAAPVFSVAVQRTGEILAGGPGVVWRSTDGGATFASLPVALPEWAPAPPALQGAAVEAVGATPAGAIFADGAPGLAVRTAKGAWHLAADAIGAPQVLPGGLQPGPGGTLLVRTGDGTYRLAPAPG